jgi:hypothetical protein
MYQKSLSLLSQSCHSLLQPGSSCHYRHSLQGKHHSVQDEQRPCINNPT